MHKTNPRYLPDLEVVVQHRVPVVITALGHPGKVVEAVHGYGGLVLCDVINAAHALPDVEQALAPRFSRPGIVCIAYEFPLAALVSWLFREAQPAPRVGAHARHGHALPAPLAGTLALVAIRPLGVSAARTTRRRTGVTLARAVAGQVSLRPFDEHLEELLRDAVGPGAFDGAAVVDPRGRVVARARSSLRPRADRRRAGAASQSGA